MNVTKKTLEENYLFFLKELIRINREINELPKGTISAKKIGNSIYYYHQWRDGKKVKTIFLGQIPPEKLSREVQQRKILEKQKKDILENIAVITKAIDIQRVTVDEIIKLFAHHSVEFQLVGSYYLPVIKENFNLNLPTIKTQDIDFLINYPYRGKSIDIGSLLQPLGFAMDFYADGSTYFTNGIFSIKFLTPERGKGTQNSIFIKPLKIRAIPLRYLVMLFDQQIRIERENYSFLVPSPWVFAFHKILISKRRRNKDKQAKDILQARAILREIFNKEDTRKKALDYLETLPAKWRASIKSFLSQQR